MKTLTLSNVDLYPQFAFTLRKLDVDVAGKYFGLEASACG